MTSTSAPALRKSSANFFVSNVETIGLKKLVDRPRCRRNRPGRNPKEDSKEEGFDGEVPMVFAGEEVSGQFAKPAMISLGRSFYTGSLILNNAHD